VEELENHGRVESYSNLVEKEEAAKPM